MLAPMYSCEQVQDQHAAAARDTYDTNTSCQQRGQVGPAAGAQVQQPRRAGKKKHGARPPSRRSSTTVVATDVANFRAMVQELTGFPAAAIFRPMPRRVHAHAVGNPFAALAAAGNQAGGCAGDGQAGSGINAASSLSSGAPPTVQQPVPAVMAHHQPPPGVFDGLSDIGSPEFDTWADFSIE